MKNKNLLNEREETFVSTARCDIRTAASLLSFFQHNNFNIKSKSQLFRLALESFADFIIKEHPKHNFKSRAEALEYLQQNNLITNKERNLKTLFGNLQKENLSNSESGNLKEVKTIINNSEILEASEILKTILAKARS